MNHPAPQQYSGSQPEAGAEQQAYQTPHSQPLTAPVTAPMYAPPIGKRHQRDASNSHYSYAAPPQPVAPPVTRANPPQYDYPAALANQRTRQTVHYPDHLAPVAPPAPGHGLRSRQTNLLGLIALVTTACGAILACIPVTIRYGWLLLVLGLVLGLASLFLRGKGLGFGIASLTVSAVGTMLSVAVLMASTGGMVAHDSLAPAVTLAPDSTQSERLGAMADVPVAEVQAESGTRENPYPLGTTITNGEWTVTIHSVDLDASDTVLAADPHNTAPAAGEKYILVNLTVTYIGKDPSGAVPSTVVEYITAEGNSISEFDRFSTVPGALDRGNTLYEGASINGNIALLVPESSDGVLSVQVSFLADKTFVALS